MPIRLSFGETSLPVSASPAELNPTLIHGPMPIVNTTGSPGMRHSVATTPDRPTCRTRSCSRRPPAPRPSPRRWPSGGQWANGRFGLKVENDYSLVNSGPGSDPTCVGIRTYPVEVSNTNVLPNAYVVAVDLDCINGDYNDYVFLIANVVPQE